MIRKIDKLTVLVTGIWKGATNDDACAYERSFTIRGDAVGLEK